MMASQPCWARRIAVMVTMPKPLVVQPLLLKPMLLRGTWFGNLGEGRRERFDPLSVVFATGDCRPAVKPNDLFVLTDAKRHISRQTYDAVSSSGEARDKAGLSHRLCLRLAMNNE